MDAKRATDDQKQAAKKYQIKGHEILAVNRLLEIDEEKKTVTYKGALGAPPATFRRV